METLIIGTVVIVLVWCKIAIWSKSTTLVQEQRRRATGLEPITWLLIIGGMVAAVIGMLVVYQTLLVDQSENIGDQPIPCVGVAEGGNTLEPGELGADGECDIS